MFCPAVVKTDTHYVGTWRPGKWKEKSRLSIERRSSVSYFRFYWSTFVRFCRWRISFIVRSHLLTTVLA